MPVAHVVADVRHREVEVAGRFRVEYDSLHLVPFVTSPDGSRGLARLEEGYPVVWSRLDAAVAIEVLIETPFCPVVNLVIGDVRIASRDIVCSRDSVVFVDPSTDYRIAR